MSVLINGTNGLIQAYDYQTPATGFTYTFAAGTQTLVMNPAATLATGTITMPAAPSDGMTITISSSKEITALTLNGNTGQTILNAATSMPAGSSASYVYRSANTSWFPLQSVPSLANTPIGVGQTWTDVTASRAAGTTYTNTTGRPIQLAIAITVTTNTTVNFQINGVLLLQAGGTGATANMYNAIQVVVPNGATYLLPAGLTLTKWSELR